MGDTDHSKLVFLHHVCEVSSEPEKGQIKDVLTALEPRIEKSIIKLFNKVIFNNSLLC